MRPAIVFAYIATLQCLVACTSTGEIEALKREVERFDTVVVEQRGLQNRVAELEILLRRGDRTASAFSFTRSNNADSSDMSLRQRIENLEAMIAEKSTVAIQVRDSEGRIRVVFERHPVDGSPALLFLDENAQTRCLLNQDGIALWDDNSRIRGLLTSKGLSLFDENEQERTALTENGLELWDNKSRLRGLFTETGVRVTDENEEGGALLPSHVGFTTKQGILISAFGRTGPLYLDVRR